MIFRQRIDAGRDALALVEGVLRNQEMLVGAGCDLRRMGDGHHLHLAGEATEPRADGIGHGTTDTGVDFVEHQSRRGALVGQHHLQRQQEAREFAAGGDLHHRARAGAGIGLHPELHAVDALRSRRVRIAVDLGDEFRTFELERPELGDDRLVELVGKFHTRRRQLRRRSAILLVGLGGCGFQSLELAGAGIDGGDIGKVFRGQRGESFHRCRIFPCGTAQREQPFLDTFEFGGIEIGGDERSAEMLVGLFQRVDGDVDRLHCGLHQCRH